MKQSLTLVTCLASTLLHAQTITSWTTAQGLPANDLRDIAVATNGDIWLATQYGVVHFDGTTFTQHTTDTHPGLANNDVFAIAVGLDGTVYAGTDFGMSVYSNGTYTTYTTADGLGGNDVKNIKVSPDGSVWICTGNGVTHWTGGGFIPFGSPEIPFGGTTHVAFDEYQVLLSGGLGGLLVYEGVTITPYTMANGLLSNRLRAVAVDQQRNRWIATDMGISVMNSDNVHIQDHEHVFVLPPPDELNPIADVLVDDYGRVWAAVYVDYLVTEGGVSVYVNGEWQQFETSDGLAGPNVRRLALGAGYLWVATSTGLSRISYLNIGIAERAQAASFQVFPNPATSVLTLEVDLPAGQQSPFEILDAQARRVAEGLITNERSTIDVSTFEAGVYMARIGSSVQRFVVAR